MSIVCGYGENDLDNVVGNKGYLRWHHMLRRCYAKGDPSYVGCSVDERWRKISDFLPWFEDNYIEGFELDKDLYIPGNKVYSEDTCLFIPKYLNTFIRTPGRERGTKIMRSGRYEANIRRHGHRIYLGSRDTEEEAHQLYVSGRVSLILDEVDKWEGKVKLGLLRHAALLEFGNWDEFL